MNPLWRTPRVGFLVQILGLIQSCKLNSAITIVIKFLHRFPQSLICMRTFCQPPAGIRFIFHFRLGKFRCNLIGKVVLTSVIFCCTYVYQ